jgi:glycosyltransferase involved in cell wall biosynthesis
MVSTESPPARSSPGSEHRLRVLYLIDSLGRGGAEHLLESYLRLLPDLGVDATVVALQERGGNPFAESIREAGTSVRTLGIERLRDRRAYRQVAEAVGSADPDVVHTQLEFSYILGSIAARRRGIPNVATLHTLEEPPRFSRAWARNRLTAWVLRRYADRIVAVSDHARRHHLEHLRLPPAKVMTLYNGIPTDRFRVAAGDRAEVRAEFGIPADAAVIVTVAVLRPPKGIADMLTALPEVAARVPGACYLIVGDGPARAELEDQARRQDLEGRVHFAGRRADTPRMLAAADLFVLPSHTEALPTVVAEAMAAGLPVVATRVGGTPEMVSAETGQLVEPHRPDQLAAAVGAVLGDADGAARMGSRGRAVAAERFDLHRQAGALVELYRGLATGRVTS